MSNRPRTIAAVAALSGLVIGGTAYTVRQPIGLGQDLSAANSARVRLAHEIESADRRVALPPAHWHAPKVPKPKASAGASAAASSGGFAAPAAAAVPQPVSAPVPTTHTSPVAADDSGSDD